VRGEPPLPRPLLVQPVMHPDGGDSEQTSPDRLLVDVIHRAVHWIKVGDGGEPATVPGVILINLSFGDLWRPFARVMSPLGRLLDLLAHRHGVLFLVSAGNVLERLVIPDYVTSREFEDADPEQREKAVLASLNANKNQRTLSSPAESVNALTIGAAHKSAAFNGGLPANLIDPFTNEHLSNIASDGRFQAFGQCLHLGAIPLEACEQTSPSNSCVALGGQDSSAHEAKRVEQFEAHLVRRRRCLLAKSNREYPSHRWPHEPILLGKLADLRKDSVPKRLLC
jgi:hypothetical protein